MAQKVFYETMRMRRLGRITLSHPLEVDEIQDSYDAQTVYEMRSILQGRNHQVTKAALRDPAGLAQYQARQQSIAAMDQWLREFKDLATGTQGQVPHRETEAMNQNGNPEITGTEPSSAEVTQEQRTAVAEQFLADADHKLLDLTLEEAEFVADRIRFGERDGFVRI